MMKRYLTIGLAMAWFVGKAESVKVICHVVSEDGNPVTNAVVKTTTERDRLNMSWTKPIKMKAWTVSSGARASFQRIVCILVIKWLRDIHGRRRRSVRLMGRASCRG